MSEEERIRQWKLQLQREMAQEDEEDEHDALIAMHPVAPPRHFDDEPLSDDETGLGGASSELQAGDDDLGLDLEEPAYREKAPAHPTTFELPKGVAAKPRSGYADPELVGTQATVDALQAALRERDIEIQRLRRASSAEPEGSGRLDDLRDQRLRELAKKNRQLVQVLGKERAQNAVLAAELASLRAAAPTQQPAAARAAPGGPSGRAAAPPAGADEDCALVRELREKLSAASAKAQEARQGQQALRAELVKVQRALAKEVGDDVPLAKVLEEGGSWRGRAQQITLLRAKLSELRRTASAAGVSADSEGGGGGGGAAGGGSHAVDGKARSALASIEQERRREFERLVLREQELLGEREADKAKLDAMHARVRILEAEGRANREKLKMLLTKSDNDDELVQALKQQLGRLSEQQQRLKATSPTRRAGVATAESAAALAKLGEQNAELAEQNARQEQIIIFLRDQLSRASVVREGGGLPGRHELHQLEAENGKLRELCQLLQGKLARAVDEGQVGKPP